MIPASFKVTQDQIFPELGGGSSQRPLPDDAVLLRIADQFDVHFVAYLEDDKGVESEVVITKPQLKRWRVKLETLADAAGWNGGQTAIWGWPAVNDELRLFQYPDNDEYWISHIVSPGCLLEHTDVPNPPIVMIPNPTTIFIAGLPDHDAQALLLELSIKAAGNKSPVTCRPIVIDNKWEKWNLVPDAENPFAKEYQRHFGNV